MEPKQTLRYTADNRLDIFYEVVIRYSVACLVNQPIVDGYTEPRRRLHLDLLGHFADGGALRIYNSTGTWTGHLYLENNTANDGGEIANLCLGHKRHEASCGVIFPTES